VEINLSYFSDQTTSISLTSFIWNQKLAQPYHFRHLIELNLEMTKIHGTLGEYLSAPSLKHLRLSLVSFQRPGSTQFHDRTSLFSDTKFLQGTPVLETIKLHFEDIDEEFIKGLESCITLKSLALYCCNISRFVSPFLECLESSKMVPSLDTLFISKSFRNGQGMTFEEFRRRFMINRPNVRLSADYKP
jgi:hypothetical protein